MKIERKIDSKNWRLNLPAELMEKLGWQKGDSLVLENQNNRLIIIKNDEGFKNEEPVRKTESTRKLKESPCGYYKFTKQKYVDGKCAKCDKSKMFFEHGISCPLAEKETENVVEEISKNLDNEYKITEETKVAFDINKINESEFKLKSKPKPKPKTIQEYMEENKLKKIEKKEEVKKVEEIKEIKKEEPANNDYFFKAKKLKRLKDRYDKLLTCKIGILSTMPQDERSMYLIQNYCGTCGKLLTTDNRSNVVKNNKSICNSCRKLIPSEINEMRMLKAEIKRLEKEINKI